MSATVGLVHDPRFDEHHTGPGHPERAARLDAIAEGLHAHDPIDRLSPIAFDRATPDDLALVHEPAYIALVERACEEGFAFIGSTDTHIGRWSYDTARLASGGVLAAVDAVLDGRVGRAFCNVRPPGHHAEADRAMGFCLFNHVAIAAEHLTARRGVGRVAIVDFDVHHGNGTQHAFEARADVLYVSIHESPDTLLFPGSGRADEVGVGEGRGFTVNVPMRAGSGDAEYRRAFDEQVLPALDAFAPSFVLISAGFDAARADRISSLNLEAGSFGWMTGALCEVADRYGGGRLASVLEGGYDLPTLREAAAAHVAALSG